MTRAVVLLLSLRLVAPSSPPQLDDPGAQGLLERAQQAYAANDYRAAAEALEAAYALEPDPKLLLAWAQAERLDGDCARALEVFRRLLGHEALTEEGARETRRLMAKCEPESDPELEPPLEPTPVPQPPPKSIAPPESESEPPPDAEPRPLTGPSESAPRRPWHRDPVGMGLSIGAGVVTVSAIGLLVAARVSDANAEDVADHMAFRERLDRAIAMERASIGLFAGAGALAVGSAIAFGLAARRPRVRPGAWVGGRLVGLSIYGGF